MRGTAGVDSRDTADQVAFESRPNGVAMDDVTTGKNKTAVECG